MKKNQLKKIKKQNISKTKWGCQNPQEESYGHDNQIKGKTEKKMLNFKKKWILKDKKNDFKRNLGHLYKRSSFFKTNNFKGCNWERKWYQPVQTFQTHDPRHWLNWRRRIWKAIILKLGSTRRFDPWLGQASKEIEGELTKCKTVEDSSWPMCWLAQEKNSQNSLTNFFFFQNGIILIFFIKQKDLIGLS